MPQDSIQDSTRYVVSDVHHGSVLPGERREMDRDVYLLSGADVRGGLWSNKLSVAAPDINVEGSVYAKGSITIGAQRHSDIRDSDIGDSDMRGVRRTETVLAEESTATKLQEGDSVETRELGRGDEGSADDHSGKAVRFGGCVTTPDDLLIEGSAHSSDSFKTRFDSDVYAGRLNISDAVVLGNIYAKGAVIRNSVVLGGVFCQDQLTLSNCFVHTFQAEKVRVEEKVSIFAPFALAQESIDLQAPVRAVSFADLFGDKGLTVDDEPEDGFDDGVVLLDEQDVLHLQIPGQEASGDGARPTQVVLSMTERILHSRLVQERLEDNVEILRRLSLSRHVDSGSSKALRQFEERLWNVVNEEATADREARSRLSLDELVEEVTSRRS